MIRTYARELIDEFEVMKKEYDYSKFISNLTPTKNTLNIRNSKVHHYETFINNLECDLTKLKGADGNYISEVDNPNFGNQREYQVTLTLLRMFTRKLTSDYKLQDASSM